MIDTTFDFRTDATTDDPDRSSPTLRRYHQLLWSKKLPGGQHFHLDTTTPEEYLHHKSGLGEFFLSSDSVIATYEYQRSTRELIRHVPAEDVDAFVAIGYTIGGMMVFPSNKVNGEWTINMARGMKRAIADRIDLTLECIRRFYVDDTDTPLGGTLSLYREFFALFGDFGGYVDFFLLQDLVTQSRDQVRFLLPFYGFIGSPGIPADVNAYSRYRMASTQFVNARNARIDEWTSENLEGVTGPTPSPSE